MYKFHDLLAKRIDQFLLSYANEHFALKEMISYALLPGGKRLRPLMTLSIAGEKAIDVALAIECIHTYSLIHDDLPCMDDDDERRGKPSLHIAYEESGAVLTGDALLTAAFEIASNAKLPAKQIVRCIQSLSSASGAHFMIQGQILDLDAKTKPIVWEDYETLVKNKTSALFRTSLECGGIIQNCTKNDLQFLCHFGEVFGLIYQIVDDLDDEEDPSALTILGRNKLIKMATTLTGHAKHVLAGISFKTPYLASLLEKITLSFRELEISR